MLRVFRFSILLLIGLAAACSGDGPADLTDPPATVTAKLIGIDPVGGSSSVDRSSPIVITFSHPIPDSMTAFFDCHEGALSGEAVAGEWTWNGDHTHLTFEPHGPLAPHTEHFVHVGGDMVDDRGSHVDIASHGFDFGGEWATSGMMEGGSGMGMGPHMDPDDHSGPGWDHENGSHGMVFGFTTSE